ncbi:MAG: hypothetical protein GYA61_00235 [Spirochaetales bacterium]|nr:hypothetical protein [Spirochaetales bacterium]
MNHYRLKIELKSALGTKLMADTIWGHICYGILFNEGEEKLNEFLKGYKEGSPPLILSTPFFEGYLPVPKFVHKDLLNISKLQEYRKLKKRKKINYIPAEKLLDGKDIDIDEIINTEISNNEKTERKKYFVSSEETRMRNVIDRISNSTSEDGIFTVNEYWLNQKIEEKGNYDEKYLPAIFDIYIISVYDKKRVVELFKNGFAGGYGADASTGKGHIEVNENIEEIKLPQYGNAAIALAPFVLSYDEYESLKEVDGNKSLFADVWTKYPKVHNSMPNLTNPFKKPIIFYREGATMQFKEDIKNVEFVGKCIDKVHHIPTIMQYALSPLILINLKA